ncbi:hypothetical protein M408DRAFT_327548 [Serendipita vermifera MAFF 305830]|uniref:Uncharacterized protein n=1 Tax=Serendipita vermifera MAFF 305830 TaxID=933852 RepID=A0A0C3BIF6_SERVB|nr:hypothetical protein M408DRAFT_327548 [Serendipita vermifera MAFF 305830]
MVDEWMRGSGYMLMLAFSNRYFDTGENIISAISTFSCRSLPIKRKSLIQRAASRFNASATRLTIWLEGPMPG